MNPYDKFVAAGGFTKGDNLGLFLDVILWAMEFGFVDGAPGTLIAAIFYFIIMFLAYRESLQSGAPSGGPVRAVWMWDDLPPFPPGVGPIKPGDFTSKQVVANPTKYLNWAKAKGVNQTWLHVKGLAAEQMDQKLGKFLKTAKLQGMSTQFLVEHDPFVVEDEIDVALSLIAKLDPAEWPTGVLTDMEGNNFPAIYNFHQIVKDKVDAFNHNNGSSLNMAASPGHWWVKWAADVVPAQVNGRDLGLALLALGFDVAVQSYLPYPSIVAKCAKHWCKLAEPLGRRVSVGMLVGPPGGGATAYSGFMNEFERDMKAVATSLASEESFAGMAVHDALWYGATAP